FVLALELGVAALKLLAASQGPALLGRPRRKLAAARPRCEIGRRLGLGDPLHRAFDPHLPPELPPVEDQRRTRVLLELLALAAAVTGVEDEAVVAGALQQDHSRRRSTFGFGRRKCHRL